MNTMQKTSRSFRNWAGLAWMLALPFSAVVTVIIWNDAPHAGASGIPLTLLSSLTLLTLLTVGVYRSASSTTSRNHAEQSPGAAQRRSSGITRRHFWAGYSSALIASVIAGGIGAFAGAATFLAGIAGSNSTQAPAQLFTAFALLSIPLALALLAPLSLVTKLRRWTPGKAAWRHLVTASLAIGIGASALSAAQASVASPEVGTTASATQSVSD